MELAKLIPQHLGKDRVLLTGANGLIGTHIRGMLEGRVAALNCPTKGAFDLRQEHAVQSLFLWKPTVVIHCAAVALGVGYKKTHPGTIFDDNLRMNFFVQEASVFSDVRKFVGIGSTSEYPANVSMPCKEEDLWEGYPQETTATYGISKRLMLVQSQSYRLEYGFDAIHLIPVTTYGPHDDYSNTATRVIPMLLRRFLTAKATSAPIVTCWGTGAPRRDLMYVADTAEGIVRATCVYSDAAPANLGTGRETTIRALTDKIATLLEYNGEILWDAGQPMGMARTCVNTSTADERFDFRARVSVDEGLTRTADWFLKHEGITRESA
jgi:GDP-L-fucose synthase